MSRNLMKASGQWATRPKDETYWGLDDALEAAQYIKSHAAQSIISYQDLEVRPHNGDLVVAGNNLVAMPTFSAAKQLCERAKVPHSFVARQPSDLAAQNINWGIQHYRGDEDDKAHLLLHRPGDGNLVLRATTSMMYSRLWNADYMALLKEKIGDMWRVPPAYPSPARRDDPRIRPATLDDVFEGTSVQVGQLIAPAGCYMDDKGMLLFVVCPNRPIEGPSGPLLRFAIFVNNEIGTGSWGVLFGYNDHVCGNHIIWGARGLREIRVRHVGNQVEEAMANLQVELREYEDEGGTEDEMALKKARKFEIAGTREEVVDELFAFGRKKRIDLSRKLLTAAYDRAETADRYGPPNTPYAIMSGLTELSQETEYADVRTKLDRDAGRVLEIAF